MLICRSKTKTDLEKGGAGMIRILFLHPYWSIERMILWTLFFANYAMLAYQSMVSPMNDKFPLMRH